MIYTSLNRIREHGPCSDGWAKLLRHLGKTQADDEPLALATILDSNGVCDALWCLRAVDGHRREMRLYAVWCARQVQHLITDPRSLAALDVAERHADGQATDEELAAARDAASAVARDVAIRGAGDAAWFAALGVARGAALGAARGVARGAAGDEERGVAWDVAWTAARAAQKAEFRRVFCGEEA